MQSHGTGDKYKGAGSASIDDLGLTNRESIDNSAKLRGETSEKTQRPVAKSKSIKSDRGTFTSKC